MKEKERTIIFSLIKKKNYHFHKHIFFTNKNKDIFLCISIGVKTHHFLYQTKIYKEKNQKPEKKKKFSDIQIHKKQSIHIEEDGYMK